MLVSLMIRSMPQGYSQGLWEQGSISYVLHTQ